MSAKRDGDSGGFGSGTWPVAVWEEALRQVERIRDAVKGRIARELALATRDELDALRARVASLEEALRWREEGPSGGQSVRLPPRLRESLGRAGAAIADMTAPRRREADGPDRDEA